MEERVATCPNCGNSFQAPAGLTECFCAFCGTKFRIADPVQPQQPEPQYVQAVFTDSRTGITAGSAMVPKGYRLTAAYEQCRIDEITPFGTTATAVSPDGMLSVGSRYGEHWYHFLLNGPLQLGSNRKQWKKYMEPAEYLESLADRIAGVKVTPASGGPLQTVYSQNVQAESAKLVSRFEENAHIFLPNIQCELKIQNLLCESQALISHYVKDGIEWTILTGADLFGLEYYDSSAMGALNRGMTDVLRFQAFRKKEQGTAAFGHAKEAGKPVDVIDWGAKRLYFAAGPRTQEAEVIRNFRTYAATWTQDAALNQRLEQVHMEVHRQEQASLQNAVNYAMQSQAVNARRQQQISQTLSETSNIITEGYNSRTASQDRISENWSQAIRGVDTYVTTDGRTVEHSVVSDHVYQAPNGNTIGVSGQLDEVPVDWTEIYKKD